MPFDDELTPEEAPKAPEGPSPADLAKELESVKAELANANKALTEVAPLIEKAREQREFEASKNDPVDSRIRQIKSQLQDKYKAGEQTREVIRLMNDLDSLEKYGKTRDEIEKEWINSRDVSSKASSLLETLSVKEAVNDLLSNRNLDPQENPTLLLSFSDFKTAFLDGYLQNPDIPKEEKEQLRNNPKQTIENLYKHFNYEAGKNPENRQKLKEELEKMQLSYSQRKESAGGYLPSSSGVSKEVPRTDKKLTANQQKEAALKNMDFLGQFY